MKGADLRLLQAGDGLVEAGPPAGSLSEVARARSELLARAQLELAGRLAGRSDRDDAVHGGAAAAQHLDQPLDQDGGFAGAGGGFDQQAFVQRFADPRPGGRVVERRCTSGSAGARAGAGGRLFAADPFFLVRSADRQEIAGGAGVLARPGGQEGLLDGTVEGAEHLGDRLPGGGIEPHLEHLVAAAAGAEEEPAGVDLVAQQLLGDQGVEDRLQLLAAADLEVALFEGATGLVVGDPQLFAGAGTSPPPPSPGGEGGGSRGNGGG